MKLFRYKTLDCCADNIEIGVEEGVIKSIKIEGGCEGNIQGLMRLVAGMTIEEVIRRLKGIDCEGKGTSCPDQLTKALESYLTQISDKKL